MSPQALGAITAAAALAVDQFHKAWMLGPYGIAEKGRVAVTPFLDLVLVWNTGVSYGLLTQNTDLGRWILIAVGVAGTAIFALWLVRTTNRLQATALGLIVGGALGNLIDRVRLGAVADFFLFHLGSFQWYVFNLADVWIVAGAIGLIWAWIIDRRGNRPKKATNNRNGID